MNSTPDFAFTEANRTYTDPFRWRVLSVIWGTLVRLCDFFLETLIAVVHGCGVQRQPLIPSSLSSDTHAGATTTLLLLSRSGTPRVTPRCRCMTWPS